MWLRKRTRQSLVQQNLYNKLTAVYSEIQKRFVFLMQKIEKRLSVRQKKIGLALFCLVSVLGCFHILASPFYKTEVQVPFAIDKIKLPPLQQPMQESMISHQDSINILLFQKVVDSLSAIQR